MQSNQSQEIERSQKDNLNLDPELSQHPLFSLKNDNILSRVIQALEIRISSSPEASSLFDFQGYLKDHLFNTIFNYEGIEDLVNSGVFEANGKTICGKKLAEPGIYIRCLDCELVHEIQSSLCPECYHESDHEGHRISIVTLCDGVTATCDCGDVDVVSCSCPNHKAQEIDVKALLGKLPANLLEKYQVAIKKAFYCVVCLFEISQKASLSIIKNAVFDLATQTLNGVLDFCQRAVEEISDVFSIVTGATLQNKFLGKYDAIWHECEDFFADEDPHLVNIEQSHSCECTILANLYRIGNIMGKFEQFRVNKFILESSKVLNIKEQACVEFMKYLQFLLNQDYSSYVCIEELGTLSSELLNMIGSLCIRESTVKKLVDINCQEILIKVINKGLKKAEKIHPYLSIVVDFACRRLNDFFEKRFNTADVLVKEKNSQLELIGLLASYQNKFYYPADIYLGIESEVVDYLPIIFGIHINSNLCMTLEHALAVICKFPYEQKLHYTRVFAAQWYSELLNHQLSLKTKPDKPLFSFWSGFQRIFASFVLCYLQNSITPEGVLCVFKETLPEVKANEIAENAIVGTLQALGLLRYTFIVLKSFGEVFYEMDPKTLYYNSEKDTVTLQLLLPEIDPQIVFKLLTKNFFSFCEPLCEFFENPDILIIDEPEYKHQIGLLKDFLNFIIYLMNNLTSLVNLKLRNKQTFSDEIELDNYEKKSIENLLINVLISSPSTSLDEIKTILKGNFLKDTQEIGHVILKISTLDEKTHKLRLKEEFEEQYDPYIFYKEPSYQEKAESNLSSKINKKMDLISGKFDPEIPSYLQAVQSVIYQSELPNFLSLFICKFSKTTSPLIQPVLKLILQNLQIINESELFTTNERLLKKVEQNYIKNDFINSLEKIKKDPELTFYKPCVEKILFLLKIFAHKLNYHNLDFITDEADMDSIISAEEEKKKLAKERMEKKKAEFAKKQALFANKNKGITYSEENKEASPEIVNKQEAIICQHCLEVIDESKDDYGVPANIVMTNNFYDTEEKVIFREKIYPEILRNDWWLVLSSCRHYYHKKCFVNEDLRTNDDGEETVAPSFKENCPLCKAYSNIFISQNDQTIKNSNEFLQQIWERVDEHWERLPNANPDSTCELAADEILQRTLNYFIESFHLHSQSKTLKESFELHAIFLRKFNAFYKEDQNPKPNYYDLSLLNKIESEVLSEQGIEALKELQVELLFNDIFMEILVEFFPGEKSSYNQDALIHQYTLLLKEYLAFKIIQLLSFGEVSNLTLQDCFSVYNGNETLRDNILKELVFPIQKILLVMNINKSVNSREFLPSSNFYYFLCHPEQNSMYLSELFQEVGFSFTFEDLIEQVFNEIPKMPGAQREVFNALIKPTSFDIQVIKPKIVKLAPRLVKLPRTYAEFNNKYFKRKCTNCKDFVNFNNYCICLICDEIICGGTCQTKEKGPIGNLNLHSQKCHMGLGYFVIISSLVRIIVGTPHNHGIFETKTLYVDSFGQSVGKFLDNQDDLHLVDFKDFVLDMKVEEHFKQVCNNHSMKEECLRLASISQHKLPDGVL